MTDPAEADPAEADPGEADPGGTARGSPSRRLPLVLFGVATLVVVVDQVVKTWAVAGLTPGRPRTVIAGWLEFLIVRNPGAAFSFLTAGTWVFTIVAVVVAVVIVRMSRRIGSLIWAIALGLLLGGALGNLVDRLRFGHVVDFVDMGIGPNRWYTWNVADAAISIAIVLLVVHGLFGHRLGRLTAAGRSGAVPGAGASA